MAVGVVTWVQLLLLLVETVVLLLQPRLDSAPCRRVTIDATLDPLQPLWRPRRVADDVRR